mmetsp:Transcript_15397/g.43064  ORF Transcript_15397/g.43064 Transcript_15397/m.43064 type:complete len:204 (-) Transcript_15397:21-632(-)
MHDPPAVHGGVVRGLGNCRHTPLLRGSAPPPRERARHLPGLSPPAGPPAGGLHAHLHHGLRVVCLLALPTHRPRRCPSRGPLLLQCHGLPGVWPHGPPPPPQAADGGPGVRGPAVCPVPGPTHAARPLSLDPRPLAAALLMKHLHAHEYVQPKPIRGKSSRLWSLCRECRRVMGHSSLSKCWVLVHTIWQWLWRSIATGCSLL